MPRQRRSRVAAAATAAVLLAASAGAASAQMAIPGNFQVNPAGAATYTIPIAVPPGIAGVTPSLTLEYNSQAPTGILGMGWSLGGLPTVTRCAATIAQDGARGAVTYTSTDRFCLDGQRLVAISGTYGDDGTEYRTEVDSFSRIKSYGNAAGGPAWFEVRTKSGHIMQFGYTPDSQIMALVIAQNRSVPRAWAVNKVSDTVGNFYTVQYQPDAGGAGQAYPQTISYAGNTINFVYAGGRSDTVDLYEAGAQQKVTMLLTNVQTSTSSGGVADYRLAYQQTPATRRSYLASVTLCDRAGTPACLPATTFGWNTTGEGFSLGGGNPQDFPGRPPASMAQGDVNGDGCGDLIEYFTYQGTFYVNVLLSNCNGASGAQYTAYSWSTSGNVIFNDATGPSGVFLADVDGDGRADLVIYFLDEYGIHVSTALSNGTTFGTAQPWANNGAPPNWADGITYQYYGDPPTPTPVVLWNLGVVDVDGDGRADLVAYVAGANGLETYVAFWRVINGVGQFVAPIFNNAPGFTGTPQLADINGDGRMDVVGNTVNANGWQLTAAISNGDGTFSVPNGGSFAPNNLTGWQVVSGDLNGDGRTDFFLYRASAAGLQVYLAFSNGDGTFTFQFGTQVAGNFSNNWTVSLADLNGDGRADLVASSFTSQGSWVDTFLSNGDGSFTAAGAFFTGSTGWTMFTPDINGDGRSDVVLIGFIGNPPVLRVISFITPGSPLQATSFTTGLGATTTVSYAPLTSTVYIKGTGAGYPQQDAQGAMYVVSQVNAPTGIASPATYNSSYGYYYARFDLSGRGFLGFGQMNTFDAQTGITTGTGFNQNFPFIGTVAWEWKGTSAQAFNSTNNTYQFVNASNGTTVAPGYAPYRVSLSSSQASSWDLDGTSMPTVNTSYAYDNFNNPTTVSVWTTIGSNPDGYSKTTTNTYYNDTTDWYLGRLTLAQVTATAPTPPTPPGQPTAPDMTVTSSHSGAFSQGQNGATYTLSVSNVGAGPTITGETVTVEDTIPAGLTAAAMSGSGWTCEVGIGSPNCTRSDALAAGASYPAITLTVNVAFSAPPSVTNVVTVSGGGEVNTSNDTYSDPTTINTSNGGTRIYLTAGSSWTVPSNWNSSNNTIEVIGGGGGAYNGATGAGGGGGGGGYSKVKNVYFNPGATVSYQVGAAGASGASPTNGGDTFFGGTTMFAAKVGAKGGQAASTSSGGTGGSAANGVGSTKYNGGHGGSADASHFAGGGGGGAGGPNGNGTSGGSAAAGGSATSPGGGGGGGSGGGSGGGASPGTTAGAGGAGGNDSAGTGGGSAGAAGSTGATDTATNGGAGVNGGGGGGGGGDASTDHGSAGTGGAGGAGTEWDVAHGAGGGGGGGGGGSSATANASGDGGAGGLYGAGGGGSGFNIGGQTLNGGAPAQGVIVITYIP